MDEKTTWAYNYMHDGGEYVGCRWDGKSNTDCWSDEMYRVDCSNCKINGTYADPVDPVDEKIDKAEAHIKTLLYDLQLHRGTYDAFMETLELIREVMKG
jgi:hypothetical protein